MVSNAVSYLSRQLGSTEVNLHEVELIPSVGTGFVIRRPTWMDHPRLGIFVKYGDKNAAVFCANSLEAGRGLPSSTIFQMLNSPIRISEQRNCRIEIGSV